MNEELVRRYFPPEVDPLEVGMHLGDGEVFRVVGVVGSVRHAGYGAPLEPELYASIRQVPWRFAAYVIRTDGDPESLVQPVRSALAEVDPLQTPASIRPMRWHMTCSVADRRWTASILAAFGAAALALSALGVFGVVNYTVGRRQGEIGVRMALGAGRGEVLRLVLRQGATMAAAGLALGLAAGWVLQRVTTVTVEGGRLLDPQVIGLAAAALAAVALLATLVPALRATRVDPASALRAE